MREAPKIAWRDTQRQEPERLRWAHCEKHWHGSCYKGLGSDAPTAAREDAVGASAGGWCVSGRWEEGRRSSHFRRARSAQFVGRAVRGGGSALKTGN